MDREAMERSLLTARLERIESEMREVALSGVGRVDSPYAERLQGCLNKLPRLGAPSDYFLALPTELIAEAEAVLADAPGSFRGLDHKPRTIAKVRKALSSRENVLLVGPSGETTHVIEATGQAELPEFVAKIVIVSAAGLTYGDGGPHKLFLRVAEALDVRDIDLGDYEPLQYQRVLDAIEADYPYPPRNTQRADCPTTYVLVPDCEPRLAGFICCNIRDPLWQLPLKWVWAVEESGASEILRPPPDFFTRQIDLATGFDHFPSYGH